MRFSAYPDYEDSAVAYLGFIPTIWHSEKLKHIAKYWVSNVNKVADENEIPIRLCNYTDVYYNEFIEENKEFMKTTATAEEIARFGLKEADVVITKDSESWDDIAVPALVKEVSALVCGYHLAFIRSDHNYLAGKYLFRYLQSPQINQHFQVAATGVTRFGLPKDEIGSVEIALPSIQEQHTICCFLDHKTEQIDSLIRKNEELIKKLQEKRSALISQTVTRGLPPEAAKAAGLNPHPKMKDSGIEWLGEIPEHWEMIQLRRFATRIQTGNTPPTAEERFYEDGTVDWFGPGSFGEGITLTKPVKFIHQSAIDERAARLFSSGAIMIVTIGATLGKVSSLAKPASCNQQITVLEFDSKRAASRFVTYQLKCFESKLRAIAPSATLPILSQSEVGSVEITNPPLSEQNAIAAYLDQETAKIDRLTEMVKAAIEKLAEYRSALITAAVTGKIDVRNYSDARSAH